MNDDRIERLLSGYALPSVSAAFDRRVLRDGAAIMDHTGDRTTAADLGRSVLDQVGLGCLGWLFDFIITADAEYRVDFI